MIKVKFNGQYKLLPKAYESWFYWLVTFFSKNRSTRIRGPRPVASSLPNKRLKHCTKNSYFKTLKLQ